MYSKKKSRKRFAFSTWWRAEASLDLNFILNEVYRSIEPGVIRDANTLITTTRASTAYADNVAGVWSPFLDDIPRITNKGLLVEEARTNSIRNNSMQGAVAGTPGTAPTNWNSGHPGLTRTIVGTGSENGIDYIDIRISGTTGSVSNNINFEAQTGIAAVNGQTWASGVFLAVVAGSFTNITDIAVRSAIHSVAPTYLGEVWVPTFHTSLPASLTAASRRSETGTIANASTAWIQPYIQFRWSSGVAVDITIRIGWPQLELGSFVTSPIRTTTAAATRAADVIYTALTPNETNLSLYIEFLGMNAGRPTNVVGGLGLGTTFSKSLYLARATSTNVINWNPDASEANISLSMSAAPDGVVYKAAMAIAANDAAASSNGGSIVTDAGCAIPTGMTRFYFGAAPWNPTSNIFNGYIRHVTYFPARFTNAQLQALTA